MRIRTLALLSILSCLSFTTFPKEKAASLLKTAEEKILVSADSCLHYLNLALIIYDKSDNLRKRIQSTQNIAIELDVAGYTDEALSLFDQNTIQNLPRLPKDSAEWDILAWLYTNMAYTYAYSVGNYDLAKENYEKAVQIFEAENLTIDQYVARYVYQELGNIYTRKGDYEAAKITLEKFKNISLSNEDFNAAAEAFSDLGVIFEHTNLDSLAINSYLKGLELFDLNIVSRALLEGNLAQIYFVNNQFDKALKWAKQAHNSFEIIDENSWHYESKVRLANNHNLLGSIYSKEDDFEKAENHFLNALDLMRNHYETDTLRREFGKIHFTIGTFYLENELFEKALFHEHQALQSVLSSFKSSNIHDLPSATSFYAENVILDALEAKADIYFQQYLKKPNRLYLENSLACHSLIFEAEKAYRKFHRYRSSKLEVIEGSYFRSENAINVALKFAKDFNNDSQKAKAFSFAEKSKSVLLFEALKHSDAKSIANIPNSILEKENELNEQVTELEKNLFFYKNSANTPKSTIDSLENEILNSKKKYDDLIAEIEKEYPSYHNLKYGQEDIRIDDIQSKLKEEEALVEYFVGVKKIFIFLINKHQFEVISIEKNFPLEDLISQFRKDIEQFQFEQTEALCTSYSEKAFELYERLIRPLESYDLPENLVIIPSGVLSFLPFDALLKSPPQNLFQFNQHDYLINHHNIVYNYSATLWLELLERKTNRAQKVFFGFAPDFSENNTSGFGGLKFNVEILNSLQDIFNGEFFIGESATKSNFEKLTDQYKIIHFATHAKANSEEGDFSFIVLSKGDETYDSLFVKDIYHRELLADLVFLGACETGVGKLHTGEGIISLARSFLYAGANSVVTTLWSVNDEITKNIALDFYKNLKGGNEKNEALRTAKMNHFKNKNIHPNFAHPVYWAAYSPVGNMTKAFDNQWFTYGLGSLTVLILFFTVFWKYRNQTKASE